MGRRDRQRSRSRSERRTEDEVRFEEYPEGLMYNEPGYAGQPGGDYVAKRPQHAAAPSRAPAGRPARGGELSGRRPSDDYGPGIYGQDAGARQRAEQRGYAMSGYGAVDEEYQQPHYLGRAYGSAAPPRSDGPEEGHAVGGAGIGGYVEGSFGQGGPIARSIFQAGPGARRRELSYSRRPSPAEPAGGHRGKGPRGYQRSDQRILDDVCDALCDDDLLDASDIEVNVENGEVLLTGTAPDRFSKRRAEDLAEQCPGVHDVQNQLRVKRPQTS